MEDFERELKLGFLDEAVAGLSEMEQSFLSLEADPQNSTVVDKIFRLAHNLKGSSKAVGFDAMGAFTHEFESLLLKVKNKELDPTPNLISLLLNCADHVSAMVLALRTDFESVLDSADLLQQISDAKEGKLSAAEIQKVVAEVEIPPVAAAPVETKAEDIPESLQEDFKRPPSAEAFEETISIDEIRNLELVDEHQNQFQEPVAQAEIPVIKKLEAVSKAAAESAPAKPSAPPTSNAAAAGGAGASAGSATADETIRVSVQKIERLMNYVGEMTILQAVLKEQCMGDVPLILKKTVHQLGKVGKEVQDISLGLRMVPIKPTFQKMQRIVRDTAKSLNKEIQLNLSGEDCELDKTVLELVNDPLVHLIRNSVDHGIESSGEQRLAAGKTAVGQVWLKASHEGGKFLIEVKDDGGGIDPQKIKQKAIQKGLIKADADLSDQECINLIFLPSFSTKEVVTDVSGRGVGMDVVKTNVEELGGEVKVESKLGQGSVFKVYLPLTMAIIDGMVVKAGNERFVIPLVQIHESLNPKPGQIRSTAGVGDLLLLRGENLPVFRLASLMGRKSNSNLDSMIAIVIRNVGQAFAILVDDIIGQYQVVIKQLGPDLQHLRGVSGSTILGDGRPALIVEPVDLVSRDLKNLPKESDLRRTS